MATTKRRITISLPKEVDEVLLRYSKLTGCSQSAFVVDCLEQNVPSLNALCEAVEAASAGNQALYQEKVQQALGASLLKLMEESK